MAVTNTTNYGLNKLDHGTPNWDTYINNNMDTIDSTMKTNANSVGNLSNINGITKTDVVTALNELNNAKMISKSANYTLTYADRGIVAVTTATNVITITLPSAATAQVPYIIKKVDSGLGSITISTSSSQLIDGVTTKSISYQYGFIAIVSDGTGWQMISLDIGIGANQLVKRDVNGNVLNIGNQITALSANTTLTYAQSGIINVTTGASTITITLPSGITAQVGYTIKKVDSGVGTITIATTSSQTIDGVTTKTITNQYANITVVSDGSNWIVDIHNDLDKIGILSGLTTTDKTSVVNALNETRARVTPIANGGTGSSTQNFVDLTTAQTIAGVKTFSSAINAPQNPNLLFNPSFRLGSSGWSGVGTNGFSVIFGGTGDGGILNNGSSSVGGTQVDNHLNFLPAYAAITFALSCEIYAGGVTAGSIGLQWFAFDSNKSAISGGSLGATNGTGWTKYSLTFTTPANTAYIQVACIISANTTNTNAAWRKIKLEGGSVATIFSDDNTFNTQQYGSVLPLIQAISSGNKIQSGSNSGIVTTAGTAITVTTNFSTPFATGATPIVTVTPTTASVGDAGYINVRVTTTVAGSFTVTINSYVAQTIEFNWEAIGS